MYTSIKITSLMIRNRLVNVASGLVSDFLVKGRVAGRFSVRLLLELGTDSLQVADGGFDLVRKGLNGVDDHRELVVGVLIGGPVIELHQIGG